MLRSFYLTLPVNIANTNVSHMTILDYVALFLTFSLFQIFFSDILSQKFDSMIDKSFPGVENVIPYPIHTDLVVGFPLLRLTYSKIRVQFKIFFYT